MTKSYDLYAIGNALVDMEYEVHDEFFNKHRIDKGLMTLVDDCLLYTSDAADE